MTVKEFDIPFHMVAQGKPKQSVKGRERTETDIPPALPSVLNSGLFWPRIHDKRRDV